jgi:hypothetical protein
MDELETSDATEHSEGETDSLRSDLQAARDREREAVERLKAAA